MTHPLRREDDGGLVLLDWAFASDLERKRDCGEGSRGEQRPSRCSALVTVEFARNEQAYTEAQRHPGGGDHDKFRDRNRSFLHTGKSSNRVAIETRKRKELNSRGTPGLRSVAPEVLHGYGMTPGNLIERHTKCLGESTALYRT